MRVIRRVDHVLVYVSDPHVLFRALTERLGLPTALPVIRVPGFHSGLVVLGDVLLEVIRPAPGRRVGVPLDQGAFGIALEPEPLEAAVAELRRRSIPHGLPFPDPTLLPQVGLFDFQPPVPPWNPVPIGGLLGDRWLARIAPSRLPLAVARRSNQMLARIWRTRVADTMFQLMTLTPQVFLVEFHPQIRAALDPDRTRRLLADAGGGQLGLTGIREIVIGTPNIDRETERWQALLEPAPTLSVGHWKLPKRPLRSGSNRAPASPSD
jgi:hypothetical protein